MNPKVDEYLAKTKQWKNELIALRMILLECGLVEDFKWRGPCYTHEGGNIAIIGELKDCCTLSFFKGVLLKNSKKLLEKPGKNSRAARVIRFTEISEIESRESALKSYIREAIKLEKEGAKVDFEKDRELELPIELKEVFEESPHVESAFEKLTPGRKRGYIIHFTGAKQSKSRRSRIENCVPKILAGKGFHDCVCGLSKRLPNCDGSHKSISK